MWPFLAFALVVVIVLVLIDVRLGAPPGLSRQQIHDELMRRALLRQVRRQRRGGSQE